MDGNGNQKWVYTYVTYDSDDVTKFDEDYDIMTLGYAYGDEGENFNTPTPFLMPEMDYKSECFWHYDCAILCGMSLLLEISLSQLMEELLVSQRLSFLTLNSEYYSSDTYGLMIERDFSGAQFLEVEWQGATITLDVYQEARYTPMDIMFQNKDGAMQSFTFFKDRKEETSVTDSVYESNRGQGRVDIISF